MVKIISNANAGKATVAEVEMAGDITTIITEIGAAINGIYNEMRARNKKDAGMFRFLLTELFSSEFSPLWDADDSHISCNAAIVRKGAKLTGDDIAGIVAWVVSLPPHVNINDIEVMPSQQANAYMTFRKQESETT